MEKDRRGRPKGKLTAGSMRGVIPSLRCDIKVEVWIICEAERRGIGRADLIREILGAKLPMLETPGSELPAVEA